MNELKHFFMCNDVYDFKEEKATGMNGFHFTWQKIVPEPFASDRKLSARLGSLAKF